MATITRRKTTRPDTENERTLAEAISPRLIRRAVATLAWGMKAKRTYVRGGKEIEEPDAGVRVKAAEDILSWGPGKPVERQYIIKENRTTDQSEAITAEALKSPATRDALRRKIREAEDALALAERSEELERNTVG